MAFTRSEWLDPAVFRFELPGVLRRMGRRWQRLRVEEHVDDRTLVVRVELPDIDPDKDVELSVSSGVLHIRARREARTRGTDTGMYRSEFRYGSFGRNLALPDAVKEADITATYKDGILEVRAPLAIADEKPPARQIPVRHG